MPTLASIGEYGLKEVREYANMKKNYAKSPIGRKYDQTEIVWKTLI